MVFLEVDKILYPTAVSLLTYRDCRHFLCGGSEVIGGLFFLYPLREFCVDQWSKVARSSAIVG